MRICPRCRSKYPTSERFCRQDASVLVEPGDMARIGTAVGNYHLSDILGRGGMGTVYSGEHVYIGKRVAVKVLHPRFAKYEDAVKRFLREARAASSINHPNIVDVTDFGPTPDGGVYFVMEYLEGTSLEDLIEKKGALPLHRGLNVANQLALALAAAHDKGIIHRDLKPDNVMLIQKPGRRDLVRMLRPDPRDDTPTARFVIEKEPDYDFAKILDFGIAKVLHREEMAPGETLAGAVFGTPEYMSPEAARGEEVDARADIYSAGVILFDMLTGRPPFEASAAAEVLAMQINKAPPSPREIAPHLEITEAAERLILKAMSKEPERRHQSMDEFRDELQRCYGSVAYRRHTQLPGEHARGAEARRKRLTEELDDWLHSDQNHLTLEQARQIAMAEVELSSNPELVGEPTEPHTRPDEFDD
jgi:eukaryotic-like serine/threonine-protein kinase